MNNIQSNALWLKGVCCSMYGDDISTDTHPTEAHADAVCRHLKREGFGGMRQHFPVMTWVSPVQQPQVIHCACRITNLDGQCVECGKEIA